MECIGMNIYDSQAGPTTDLVSTLEENSLCSVSANNLHLLHKNVHNLVLMHIHTFQHFQRRVILHTSDIRFHDVW